MTGATLGTITLASLVQTASAETSQSGNEGNNSPAAKPEQPKVTEERHTEPIPFKTKEVEDENLDEGVRKVVQKGQEGLREFIKTTTSTQGSGEPVLTKESTAVKNADGTYTQKIQVVSDPKKTKVEKPTDLLLIMDGSGSLLGKNTKNGPRVLETAMRDARALVNSLPDGSQVSIMSYTENNSDSYHTPYYTKLLSKADAIAMLDDMIKLTPKRQRTGIVFGNRMLRRMLTSSCLQKKCRMKMRIRHKNINWIMCPSCSSRMAGHIKPTIMVAI